jgi:ERCC4-type nuclease
LTDALHTVHGVLTAARGELSRVPGVGPRRADRILSLRTP